MPGTPHPLDPLSADEISLAATILRREQGIGERWRFASIELREPSKAVVGAFTAGDPIVRGRSSSRRCGRGDDWHG